ncbi:MMPL family transporter [Roseateles sp. BYS180W]|uniref:MMPL family transporter n=1 Tax=Roseateles rivi TaxID=3299028 RepID=A0ABW7FQV2_9BURK
MRTWFLAPHRHRRLAWLWLALVLAVLGHNAWLWLSSGRVLDSDIMAMLPKTQQDEVVGSALRGLAQAGEGRVIVLVGATQAQQARAAGDTLAEQLRQQGLQARYQVAGTQESAWVDFYRPRQGVLLTPQDRQLLQTATADSLVQQALAGLHQTVGMPRLEHWTRDPLNLAGRWMLQRAQLSPVRVEQGRLMVQHEGWHYAVLVLQGGDSAFALRQQQDLVQRLDAAQAQARLQWGSTELRLLRAGIPLFAVAAAEQAHQEVHTIGLGSLIAVVLLTWWAFGSLRPRVLVTLSMAVGLLAAVSTTWLVFGNVHLLTLVFGATLLGVAENYGSNYFCARMGSPLQDKFALLGVQWPTVSLAMLTTVVAYALMAIAPFPGLQQMALFSATGLVVAFVTVQLWFPWLEGAAPAPRPLARWLGGWRARWWQPKSGAVVWALGALLLATVAVALLWRSNDDIRSLQSAPPQLIEAQREVGRIMRLPALGQFYVVTAAAEQDLLQREEALVARIEALGVRAQAVSQWVPSLRRQAQDGGLRQQRLVALRAPLAQAVGQDLPSAPNDWLPLHPEAWLQSAVSEPLRAQWLGQQADGRWASVVLLHGDPSSGVLPLPALAALQDPAGGVSWVDKVGSTSQLMQHYRVLMVYLLLVGYGVVWAVLACRFGRRAWRALAPTALASMLSVALLLACGQSLQLFHVLPLLILLGLGVDYGIFLLEQPQPQLLAPFLSVSLSALSTLMSFGLLALSSTPALRAFGLTMLLGVSLSWWLSPVFLPQTKEHD